jgi:DeoR/GlpR family transcriptional regulator of sugar metabolism
MPAVDRRHRILERVAEEQTIHIRELATDLDVSEMTIRRDITRLERDGFLRRTYGGATAHVTRSLELAFNARALQSASAKRLIGMTAAPLVAGASTLFVGTGTTAEQLALFLPARDDVTVVTNSLPVASLLGPDKPGNTGKDTSSAPGAKFAKGGSSKMFGFHGAEPQQAGRTSAR